MTWREVGPRQSARWFAGRRGSRFLVVLGVVGALMVAGAIALGVIARNRRVMATYPGLLTDASVRLEDVRTSIRREIGREFLAIASQNESWQSATSSVRQDVYRESPETLVTRGRSVEGGPMWREDTLVHGACRWHWVLATTEPTTDFVRVAPGDRPEKVWAHVTIHLTASGWSGVPAVEVIVHDAPYSERAAQRAAECFESLRVSVVVRHEECSDRCTEPRREPPVPVGPR